MTLLKPGILAAASLLFCAAASAQEAATTPTLLPNSLSLPLVEGSEIPTDCRYPASITNAERFEVACVTMPQDDNAGQIAATYIGMLGEAGWRQGNYISAGFTAVRTDDQGCEQVLNIFPADFPPGAEDATTEVIWFALDRTPRCAAPQTAQ